jgi:hypothetical protein
MSLSNNKAGKNKNYNFLISPTRDDLSMNILGE